jgi:hypothetical protein
MPIPSDVPVNPAAMNEMLMQRKIITAILAGEEQKK